ncbi:AI-2E family transporter [Thermococcus sp.]
MELEAAVWIAISLIILYLVWKTVSPILSPIIIAITIVYIVYPVHERWSKRLGNRGSAFLLTAILTVLTFLFIIGFALWMNDIKHSITTYLNAFFQWLLSFELPQSTYDLLQKLLEDLGKRIDAYVLGYTYSIPKLTLQAVVMLFVFYGVLVNAKGIKNEVYSLLPGENRELAIKLVNSATSALHNLLRGWLTFSVIKGISLALAFYFFGLANAGGAIAAGILTVLLELLPFIGGWIMWLAGAVYLFESGMVGRAILIALYGVVFVSPGPDLVVKPRLGIERKVGVNALISLLGIFGGLVAFGLVGIIIGPVALSLMETLLEEWKRTKITRTNAG